MLLLSVLGCRVTVGSERAFRSLTLGMDENQVVELLGAQDGWKVNPGATGCVAGPDPCITAHWISPDEGSVWLMRSVTFQRHKLISAAEIRTDEYVFLDSTGWSERPAGH